MASALTGEEEAESDLTCASAQLLHSALLRTHHSFCFVSFFLFLTPITQMSTQTNAPGSHTLPQMHFIFARQKMISPSLEQIPS